MIIDSIGDCFSRLRNASRARREFALVPYSKVKENILKLLKNEGFVGDVSVEEGAGKRKTLCVRLKYQNGHQPVLEHISRVSKPGQRTYTKSPSNKGIRQGMGFQILSTPKGILTDRKAAELKVGGEIIGEVW